MPAQNAWWRKGSDVNFARRISLLFTGITAATASIVIAAPMASAADMPCGAQAKACVQLSTNRTWLVNNGAITYGPAPVTSGKPGYRTPTGTFHVQYKDIDHYSKQFHGPMPYSVFFTTTGVAFHQGNLKVTSSGCIHLSHEAAVKYFNTLQVGDVVQVVH
jgi:hypothetical protein